ncbi:hypothetical protein BKK54_02035 [Rodentibacter genomosp. 1]|uniref:Exonuclease n=1 Tax=Rodentibacter genomosp. 1 TaxID=1908264 RepID=A0A1V3J8P4_9PAST|nr:hypothetical protein [Rodentibacter genomosp. 1]OOF51780.1 hypothetical protein BKK54_02035 [Rodentibacter genomosp. 1]
MIKFLPHKTKILFLDLEYYVPENDRDNPNPGGMSFSPTSPTHKVIGGCFQIYYPMKNRPECQILSFWEWKLGSEENIIKEIYKVFISLWKGIHKSNNCVPMCCGIIGISHSDLPVLYTKMLQYKLDTPENLFYLIFGTRQLDLSCIVAGQFTSKKHNYFFYPKTKSQLYQKYLPKAKRSEHAISVWKYYDDRAFEEIEQRTRLEIIDSLKIYKKFFEKRMETENILNNAKKQLKTNNQ